VFPPKFEESKKNARTDAGTLTENRKTRFILELRFSTVLNLSPKISTSIEKSQFRRDEQDHGDNYKAL